MDYDIGAARSTEEVMIDMEGTDEQGLIMDVDVKSSDFTHSSTGLVQKSVAVTHFLFSTS